MKPNKRLEWAAEKRGRSTAGRWADQEGSVSTALPKFFVIEVDGGGSSTIVRGSVSATKFGNQTWIGDGHVGYLKYGNFLAPGRWRVVQDHWEFVLERQEDANSLGTAHELEVFDGYWGERAALVLDTKITWAADQWTKQDHDHCAICWATISEMENSGHFVATTGERVCSPCYRQFVDKRTLGFIQDAAQPAAGADR